MVDIPYSMRVPKDRMEKEMRGGIKKSRLIRFDFITGMVQSQGVQSLAKSASALNTLKFAISHTAKTLVTTPE